MDRSRCNSVRRWCCVFSVSGMWIKQNIRRLWHTSYNQWAYAFRHLLGFWNVSRIHLSQCHWSISLSTYTSIGALACFQNALIRVGLKHEAKMNEVLFQPSNFNFCSFFSFPCCFIWVWMTSYKTDNQEQCHKGTWKIKLYIGKTQAGINKNRRK